MLLWIHFIFEMDLEWIQHYLSINELFNVLVRFAIVFAAQNRVLHRQIVVQFSVRVLIYNYLANIQI